MRDSFNNGTSSIRIWCWTITIFLLFFFVFEDDELLLGELQYAFLTFLVGKTSGGAGEEGCVCGMLTGWTVFIAGHSFAGFEQWKRLIVLMCSCEDAMITLAPFYYKFIGILPVFFFFFFKFFQLFFIYNWNKLLLIFFKILFPIAIFSYVLIAVTACL